MSLSLVMETEREVRRLLVAGSALASEDFRLKRILPQMSAAGAKVPVFARVADGISKVVEAPSQESAASLLELATLVNAILYTQGQTGVTGEASPVETAGLGYPTTLSLRKLKPLIEALTRKGAGRTEIIRQYAEEGPEADIRLIKPLLQALGDGYLEIAELAEQLLTGYGTELVPVLKTGFNWKGGKAHARRLPIIYKLAGLGEKEFYLCAVELGDAEIKLAAITLLKGHPEFEDVLLAAARHKREPIRRAAFAGLGGCDTQKAADVLLATLHSKDYLLAQDSVMTASSRRIMLGLIAAAERYVGAIAELGGKAYTFESWTGSSIDNLMIAIDSMVGRAAVHKEPEVFSCLKQLLAHGDGLRKVKVHMLGNKNPAYTADQLVANGLLLYGTEAAFREVEAAYLNHGEPLLQYGMEAALRLWEPSRVYDAFSPYLMKDKKAAANGKAVLRVVNNYVCARGRDKYVNHPSGHRYGRIEETLRLKYTKDWRPDNIADIYLEEGYLTLRHDRDLAWDSRWLKLLAEQDEVKLVSGLVTPAKADRWCKDYLLDKLEEKIGKPGRETEIIYTVLGLIQMELPEFRAIMLDAFDRIFRQAVKGIGMSLQYMCMLDGLSFLPRSWAGDLEQRASAYADHRVGSRTLELVDFLKSKGADGHE